MSLVTATRRDWRETLRAFSDLAIIGFAVVIAALPLVSAGAAVAAGSAAVHHWCEHDRLPPWSSAWRWFVRGLLPGLGAAVNVALAAALLALDVAAIRSGTVPGGPVALGVTVLVAAALLGLLGVALVRIGQRPSEGWARALLGAYPGPATDHGWSAVVAVAGVLTLGATLTVALPVTTPLLVGFTIFGLHTVTRRLSRQPRSSSVERIS